MLLCLKEDEIKIDDIVPLQQHSIVDIKRPRICVDRLDGVLHTNLIWLSTWKLSDVEYVYKNMKVLKNENGKDEIGFQSIEVAEYFCKGVQTYGIALQSNEDKLMMQLIADVLKNLLKNNLLSISDFYRLSELDIIKIIEKSNQNEVWKRFSNLSKIERSNVFFNDSFYIIESFKTKKRYVIPLCEYQGNIVRLNEISKECNRLLKEYQNFQDSRYAYIKK